jgi:hypothetical protein
MSTELKRWWERVLGLDPVAAGEDTQWQLRGHLNWPDWLVVVVVALAVLVAVGLYLRESAVASRRYRLALALVRLSAVAVLFFMLAGFELIIDRTGLPYLVLLVDDSESMSIKDVPARKDGSTGNDKKRLEQVQGWLSDQEGKPISELTRQHKIQLYSNAVTPQLRATAIDAREVPTLLNSLADLKPTGSESRLGSNLRSVLNSLRGTPPSAVVLITDGVTTQGEPLAQAAQYASRKNIPIFTVGVGNPGEIHDWEIRDILVDDTVFVGDLVSFQVKVAGRGFAGESTTIKLVRKGFPDVIDERTIAIAPGSESTQIELSFRPGEPGADTYEILLPTDAREIVKENNRAERRVEAIKEKVRVLYVESYPRYEFRFLKNLLEREETIELAVLLSDSDPEYLEEDKSAVGYFPTTRDELFTYDVVILGDVPPNLFSASQIDHLRDFVRVKGGGVLFIAGSAFNPRAYRDTPIEELLPVELAGSLGDNQAAGTEESFQPRLTREGRTSPIFRFGKDEAESTAILQSLPGAYWFVENSGAKPAATVLAEHPAAMVDGKPVPLLATQFFGAGRTIYQGFTGTWRWRYRVEDLYLARYWVQSVRLLSRSKLLGKNKGVEVTVDRRRYRRGDPVQVAVRMVDESLAQRADGKVAVQIDRADGTVRTLELARRPEGPILFEGVFDNAEDGVYRVRLASPLIEGIDPTEFTVVPPPGELDRIQMNESELQAVAEQTGGKYTRIESADSLFRQLPMGRKVAIHTDPPIELWNKWPVLVLLVSLLALEWVLRKRKSMA